jgi:hypothetical protein
MSGVFQNIDPHSLTARRVCTPPPLVLGEDTFAGWRGGGSIFWKTLDTALYSSYVITLWILYIFGGRIRSSEAAMDRGGGAQRPVWGGKELKNMGARSARARTRGQNPLVFVYFTICATDWLIVMLFKFCSCLA